MRNHLRLRRGVENRLRFASINESLIIGWGALLERHQEFASGNSFEFANIETIAAEIASSQDLSSACLKIEEHLQQFDIDLISVLFAHTEGSKPAVRPFRRASKPLVELATLRREAGGCPILVEARRLKHPYDPLTINRDRFPDFIGQRFLDELSKQGHKSIATVPVVIGDGMAVFTAGLRNQNFSGELKYAFVNAVCQLVIAIIGKFPEVTKLFRPKVLTTIEAETLLLKANGNPVPTISTSLGVSPFTIELILSSAVKKLGAHSLPHAISKALAMGEIINMHVGRHDFI